MPYWKRIRFVSQNDRAILGIKRQVLIKEITLPIVIGKQQSFLVHVNSPQSTQLTKVVPRHHLFEVLSPGVWSGGVQLDIEWELRENCGTVRSNRSTLHVDDHFACSSRNIDLRQTIGILDIGSIAACTENDTDSRFGIPVGTRDEGSHGVIADGGHMKVDPSLAKTLLEHESRIVSDASGR